MKNQVLFTLYSIVFCLSATNMQAQEAEKPDNTALQVSPTYAQKQRFKELPALEGVTVTHFSPPYSDIKILDADNRERTFLITDKTTFFDENNEKQKPNPISKATIKEDALITLVYTISNNKLVALDITVPKQIVEETTIKPQDNAQLDGILEAFTDDIAIIGGSKVKLLPLTTITCVSKSSCDCKCPGLKKDQKGKAAYIMDSTLVGLAPYVKVKGAIREDGILYAEELQISENIQSDLDKQYLAKLHEVVSTKNVVLSPHNDNERFSYKGNVSVAETSYEILEDSIVQMYINAVGQKVTPQWVNKTVKGKTITPSFYVLNNPNPDAFSYGDGKVFITTGLLKMVKNEHQLAFILANQVAQITHNQSIDVFKKKITVNKTSKLAKVGIGVGIGVALVVVGVSQLNKGKKKNKEKDKTNSQASSNKPTETQKQTPSNNQPDANGQTDTNVQPIPVGLKARKQVEENTPIKSSDAVKDISNAEPIPATIQEHQTSSNGTKTDSPVDQNGSIEVSDKVKTKPKIKTISKAEPISEAAQNGQTQTINTTNINNKASVKPTKSIGNVKEIPTTETKGESANVPTSAIFVPESDNTTPVVGSKAIKQGEGVKEESNGQVSPTHVEKVIPKRPTNTPEIVIQIELNEQAERIKQMDEIEQTDTLGQSGNTGTTDTTGHTGKIGTTDTTGHTGKIGTTDTTGQTGKVGTTDTTQTKVPSFTPKQTVEIMLSIEDIVKALKPLYFNSMLPASKELQADRVGLFYMKQAGYDITEAPKLWDNVLIINEDKSVFQSIITASAKTLEPAFANIVAEKKITAQGAINFTKDFVINLATQTAYLSAYKAKKRLKQANMLLKTQYQDVKPLNHAINPEGFSYLKRILE